MAQKGGQWIGIRKMGIRKFIEYGEYTYRHQILLKDTTRSNVQYLILNLC